MAQVGHRYTVYPSSAFLELVVCSSLLLAAHLTGLVLKLNGHSRVFGFVRLFDMDLERNVPTLFSTELLMTGSFLFSSLWCVRRGQEQHSTIWLFLSGTLLFLAIDEFCQIHESFNVPERALVESTGFFFEAVWVVPYGIVSFGLLLFLLPFLHRQETKTRNLLFLSGGMFFTGAVGVEMLSGKDCDVA